MEQMMMMMHMIMIMMKYPSTSGIDCRISGKLHIVQQQMNNSINK